MRNQRGARALDTRRTHTRCDDTRARRDVALIIASHMLALLRRPLLGLSVAASSTLVASAAHAAPAPAGSAVVVGVSHRPGLGFAIAERFARGGMAVGLIGRQAERLEECKQEILRAVPDAQVEYVQCDATDPSAVASAFAGLKAAHGSPDALIYNLSCRPFPPTPVAEITPERLESDWRTGPLGALLCVQQVVPSMRERGSGTILFTGASASLRGSANFGSFTASKSGLRVLAQSLCKELGPEGIHVAHVVIDAIVDMPLINQFFPDATPGRKLDPEGAAEYYWQLHAQDKRAFTFESDLRPHEAQW